MASCIYMTNEFSLKDGLIHIYIDQIKHQQLNIVVHINKLNTYNSVAVVVEPRLFLTD